MSIECAEHCPVIKARELQSALGSGFDGFGLPQTNEYLVNRLIKTCIASKNCAGPIDTGERTTTRVLFWEREEPVYKCGLEQEN